MIEELTRLSPGSVLGVIVRLPLRLLPKGMTTTVRAGINKGAAWIVGSSVHGCWLGTYEAEKQDVIARTVRPGMVVWDVGANAGYYTLAFSRLVGPTGRVFSFEPLAENANNLLLHARLNALGNVSIIQAALGDACALSGFETAESNSMGRLSSEERSYLVPTLTADHFLSEYPDARPDVIKVDIEGGESAFLSGARGLLTSEVPTLILSLHGASQSMLCCEALRGYGFSISDLDGTPLTEDEATRTEVIASAKTAV